MNFIGRSTSGTGNESYKLVQTLTGVSKFAPHQNGCWAIKTNGTLWWCGSISSYAASGDTGQSTISVNYGWLQYGSDTDWIDIDAFPNFPTACVAIKGSTGSEYLYSCGSNYWGRLGVGTTSGSTKPWTRVKSYSTTNCSETIEKVSIVYQATLIVTKGGKFFAIGDGNDGLLGQGNTTDHLYPVQVGTDTDWDIPYAKPRLIGYCIKTDGTLYGSTRSSSFFGIQPTTQDRTYRQIGTDTDYEDLRTVEYNATQTGEVIFAKKNGSWDNLNYDSSFASGSWMGNTSTLSPPTTNTWVTINSVLGGNDLTVTVKDVLISYKNGNASAGVIVTFATAAS